MAGRWLVASLALGVVVVGVAAMGRGGPNGDAPPSGTWTTVRKVVLAPSILVAGDVFSRKRTVITVDVESMKPPLPPLPGRRRMVPSPTSTILWIVPNGSLVKKDDVICRLDSAWFENEAAQQEIETGRALAEVARTERTLEIAQVELRAFREGERLRQQSQNRTNSALARTTVVRVADRLDWIERMSKMGYVSTSDLTATQTEAVRAAIDVARNEALESVYDIFWSPRMERFGQVLIEQAETEIYFAKEQANIETTRLANLRKQIEKCTIKAPHDGQIVYADIWYDESYKIRVGTDVYTNQELFYLPERGTMAIQAVVPESQAMRVRAGQAAIVHVGAFPDRTFPGKVEIIERQPIPDWKKWDDIPIFYATVAIEDPDQILFIDMSASIEIMIGPEEEKLTVSSEAVAVENEQAYCDVLVDSAWKRRAIEIAPATTELVEVRSGLQEGDRVRLHPWQVDRQAGRGG
jgi:HlyD family secretion protein